ncbi:amidohydrolase family protein [Actinopolymorpha singaporensis]|uniref:L-fuconolactonase n=1 Tax=Actinopolymorpha singaporensis TaxID=117157 RepID=A0A1H1XBY9_9ACTN|nr:amidohydrolase family protein [Actinopolymorpha singaporensis]SDT06797.1 L-fuconolactonase [Actinopolymorpha singaporensis]
MAPDAGAGSATSGRVGGPGGAAHPGGVDAHHHVWDLSVRPEPWIAGPQMAPIDKTFHLSDLEPHAKAAGVTRTVLVQTVPDLDETRDFLALAEGSDLVGAVTGWVDLTADSVADDLAELAAAPGGRFLRAVRHGVQGEEDPAWLCRPDVRRGLAAVAGAGLRYELLTLPEQLPAAVETVEALPEAAFVLDHCSKPEIARGEREPWAGLIRRLAAYPNVTCKLSGLVTEADWASWDVATLRPYVDVVLEAFGPDRVMFGSDWPVCLLASSYADWVSAARELTAHLDPSERADVFGGTARRVYALD